MSGFVYIHCQFYDNICITKNKYVPVQDYYLMLYDVIFLFSILLSGHLLILITSEMVSMIPWGAEYRDFGPLSAKTKDYKICYCWVPSMNKSFRSTNNFR